MLSASPGALGGLRSQSHPALAHQPGMLARAQGICHWARQAAPLTNQAPWCSKPPLTGVRGVVDQVLWAAERLQAPAA